MIKTVAGLEVLDLSFFQMKMMPNMQRKQWMERSDKEYHIISFPVEVPSEGDVFCRHCWADH